MRKLCVSVPPRICSQFFPSMSARSVLDCKRNSHSLRNTHLNGKPGQSAKLLCFYISRSCQDLFELYCTPPYMFFDEGKAGCPFSNQISCMYVKYIYFDVLFIYRFYSQYDCCFYHPMCCWPKGLDTCEHIQSSDCRNIKSARNVIRLLINHTSSLFHVDAQRTTCYSNKNEEIRLLGFCAVWFMTWNTSLEGHLVQW